jgi:hypothetical protein
MGGGKSSAPAPYPQFVLKALLITPAQHAQVIERTTDFSAARKASRGVATRLRYRA